MASCSTVIDRKAIDISGGLGSLYDASRDYLVKPSSVTGSKDPEFNPNSKCQVLHGAESNGVIYLLNAIKFEDALVQSILLGLVQPSGISSFINYNQPINENTYFLYYLYKHREEKLAVTAGKADQIVPLPSDLNNATHMITKIIWGFELLCVIQNSNKESAKAIETVLYNISEQLQECDKKLEFTDDEKLQLAELSNVSVFGSEKSVDTSNSSLLTILDRIRGWQRHTSFHVPIHYTLHPLKWLYKKEGFSQLYHLSDENNFYITELEPTITYLDDRFKDLQRMFKNLPKNRTTTNVAECLKDIPERFGVLSSIYEEFQTKLRDIIVEVRRDVRRLREINNVISDNRYSSLRKSAIDAFYNEVQQSLAKVKLIERLNNDKIIYVNVFDVPQCQSKHLASFEEIDEELKQHFSKQESSAILWYSSDRLKREKTKEWEQTFQQLTYQQKQEAAHQIPLIYVDFSQCQQKLDDFVIRKLPIQSSPQSEYNHSIVHPLPPSPSATEINVLMLGETGVGKSTFINAFVNYLMFNTLQQAEQSKPVVLIPVSFLITTGDQFDEFIVKFGDIDPNENYEHQGQSVTQQCKSYVFHLNDRLILRLIDTPGIGDTRGAEQDDKNIDHILTYINNLSHLNAVCLLLKPNMSQLNIFFRSCVNQLATYLTPAGYNNIIFGFTNARATFFAPGDTAPLLRQMLKKEHQNDIPFRKENTFCFDSESFRYLAARKRGVNFDDFQTQECITSWTTSVTESIRLLTYISTRQPYDLNKSQSPRKIALDISILARPLMETLRLILYNWRLREVGSVDKEMILDSTPITLEMCTHCAQNKIVERRSFWIVEYKPNKTVNDCQCSFDDKHFLIESTVKHDFVLKRIVLSEKEFETYLHNFLFQCDRLTNFLRQKEESNQVDPFASILERFLEEEQQISDTKNNLSMNKRMKEALRSMKKTRRENKQHLMQSNEKLSLKDVYKIIDELKSTQPVSQQLKSIKTSRLLKMKANEHQIELPSMKNEIFSSFINSFH